MTKTDINFRLYSDMGLSEKTTIDVQDYLAFYTIRRYVRMNGRC